MAVMEISSDFGFKWGNIVITPQELTDNILGINIIDGLLELDGVKFTNIDGREYIADQLGKRHDIVSLYEKIQQEVKQYE